MFDERRNDTKASKATNPIDWKVLPGQLTLVYFLITIAIGTILFKEGVLKLVLADNSLNSFGDFLAGLFAPVAIIWVAASFFHQIETSKQNRAETEERLKAIESEKQPRFILVFNSACFISDADPPKYKYLFNLYNTGSVATNVRIEELSHHGTHTPLKYLSGLENKLFNNSTNSATLFPEGKNALYELEQCTPIENATSLQIFYDDYAGKGHIIRLSLESARSGESNPSKGGIRIRPILLIS